MPWVGARPPFKPRAWTPWLPCIALLGLAACYQAILFHAMLGLDARHPFGDFVAIWSYARIAAEHPATFLYDWDGLRAAQRALGLDPMMEAPFPYPPSFLLVVWPLSSLSFEWAVAAWLAGTFALYAVAVLGGSRPPPVLVLATVLAPATAVTAMMGQGGFLVGALLIGGLRLANRHPVWGGVLLGLLTCKPQFGILVPFALLAAGHWRCIASACATAVGLAAASGVLLGWSAWTAWIEVLPAYQAWFDSLADKRQIQPTVLANLLMLGVPMFLAQLAQAAATCCAAACTWMAFRNGPHGMAVPVLLVGTFLATPHAFTYDLPLLSAAAILFARRCVRSGGVLAQADRVAVVLALCLPVVMLVPALLAGPDLPVPTSTPLLAVILWTFLRRMREERQERGKEGCLAAGMVALTVSRN